MSAALSIPGQAQLDIITEVGSILDFLGEALSAISARRTELSTDGAEGLASICVHLSLLCREAAEAA